MKKMYWIYLSSWPYDLDAEGDRSADRECFEGIPGSEEAERSMGEILLHHRLVQFYLLYVAGLFVAFFWDYLHIPPASGDDTPAPRNEAEHEAPGLPPPPPLPHSAGQQKSANL
jgi:hypothetical protein